MNVVGRARVRFRSISISLNNSTLIDDEICCFIYRTFWKTIDSELNYSLLVCL